MAKTACTATRSGLKMRRNAQQRYRAILSAQRGPDGGAPVAAIQQYNWRHYMRRMRAQRLGSGRPHQFGIFWRWP